MNWNIFWRSIQILIHLCFHEIFFSILILIHNFKAKANFPCKELQVTFSLHHLFFVAGLARQKTMKMIYVKSYKAGKIWLYQCMSEYQNTASEKIQIHCECAYLDRSYFTEKSWVDTLFMATRVSVPRYRRPRKLKTAWTVEIVNNILSFTDLVKFRVCNPEFHNQSFLVLPGKR